ncbi:unnamed protein product [Xylocopa violacea]|uniref:DNA-directed primase/polymerase protein n=1 Tax=Xylocopa violacea TaxID=135666 RepID=A0ABP1NEP3_XYLVO
MYSIDVRTFYGSETIAKQEAEVKEVSNKPHWVKEFRRMPSNILGPREFWMEFEKQAEALDTAFKESDDFDMLCTFVYQRDNGYRKFVVAHPERYWWYYEHRSAEKRCSYEIIPENCPCRLYLDLEYSIELNPLNDGPSMTSTLIDIFCTYLLTRWGIPCNKYNVVNLDSSTDEKFSRHLIFNVKDVAFKNNYHVGSLVKSVCKDILDYLISPEETQYNVLSCFDRTKLERLVVETKKGKKLFIDTAVYTKNRHFRIYKSTKWGKQSNLILSSDCKYIPSNSNNDKELSLFLDSLVSYFVTRKDLILLECSDSGAVDTKCFKGEIRYNYCENNNNYSKYPVLDKYIRTLIHPGKIRVCKYFEAVKILVYETSGYRYCENIDRCHKSNNVFLIVDLRNKTVYQKCHDEDCFGFKSTPRQLPVEICFQMDEENDVLLSCSVITEGIA